MWLGISSFQVDSLPQIPQSWRSLPCWTPLWLGISSNFGLLPQTSQAPVCPYEYSHGGFTFCIFVLTSCHRCHTYCTRHPPIPGLFGPPPVFVHLILTPDIVSYFTSIVQSKDSMVASYSTDPFVFIFHIRYIYSPPLPGASLLLVFMVGIHMLQ